MCGRFTYKLTWEEIVRLYRLTLDQPARNTQARYKVRPTDPVDTIVERDGKRELVSMRWGLVPRWWSRLVKDAKMATFNARGNNRDQAVFPRRFQTHTVHITGPTLVETPLGRTSNRGRFFISRIGV
jgi:putative SOS response-associated peptidase YedK